jgi:hypothetical protein
MKMQNTAKGGAKSPAKSEEPPKSTALATVSKSGDVSTAEENQRLLDAHAGHGSENVTRDDINIPRLTILQAQSPQCLKAKPEYIKGAEAGIIFDTAIKELFPEGVHVLPVHFKKEWIQWAPRASGRGPVFFHQSSAILADCTRDKDTGKYMLRDSEDYIAETAQFYGLNLSADTPRPCYIPMSSSQLKQARDWLTQLMSAKNEAGAVLPFYNKSWKLTTIPQSNDDGDWYGWKIESGHLLSSSKNFARLFAEACSLYNTVREGVAQADWTEAQ